MVTALLQCDMIKQPFDPTRKHTAANRTAEEANQHRQTGRGGRETPTSPKPETRNRIIKYAEVQ